MRKFQTPSELIRQLEHATKLEQSGASPLEVLNALLSPSEEQPPSDAFSEDYPLGGLIEPRDIDVEITLTN